MKILKPGWRMMEVLSMYDGMSCGHIALEEYFDLRQKAEMNGWLMGELGRIQERWNELDRRLFECERNSERCQKCALDGISPKTNGF